MEEMSRQLQQLKVFRQHIGCQLQRFTFLRHQELVAQILWRKAAVQKSGFQYRMAGDGALNTLRVNSAPGLPL